MTRLSEMLRVYIASHNLTLDQLAKETGIGKSTLSRLTTGGRVPCTRTMLKLWEWLLENKNERKN
jgi:transcriptional regulator with XRE-family HTH domain